MGPGTYNTSISQGSYLLYRKVDATAVNSTFTINPTTVATVGFGFNRGQPICAATVIQNGAPLPVTQTNVNSLTGTFGIGGSTQRPNVIGTIGCGSGAPEGRLGGYITTAGFAAAPALTYGNAPRTTNCYGPGYSNSDVSVQKNFKTGERMNWQFRAEALNALNTPQFSSLSSNSISSANFGKISGQLGFSRLVQLGGRLTF